MRISALLLVMFFVTPSFAQESGGEVFLVGNELLRKCQSDDASLKGFCVGFMAGASDSDSRWRVRTAEAPQRCMKGIELSQVRDIVMKYLQNNPEKRHFPAATLVDGALLDAFPCK